MIEIAVTRLLLRSYYDIVRKKTQDSVPKAIMHFLVKKASFISLFLILSKFFDAVASFQVNHAKRNLLSTFIQKLYRQII